MNIEELFSLDEHEAGAELQIKGKDGMLVDMFIKIIGPDSKKWRKLSNDLLRKSYREEGDAEENKIDALTEATLDWRGFMSDGEEFSFSKDRIKQLYTNAPYIMEQIDLFLAKRENFTKSKDAN